MLAQGCGRTEDEEDDYTMGIVRSNNDSVTGLKNPDLFSFSVKFEKLCLFNFSTQNSLLLKILPKY